MHGDHHKLPRNVFFSALHTLNKIIPNWGRKSVSLQLMKSYYLVILIKSIDHLG